MTTESPPEYLDVEDLLTLTQRLGVGPVTDVGLLHAACARPTASLLGEDVYPTRVTRAGALLHSLLRHHALADGNHHVAWLATVVFLDLNDMDVNMTDDEALNLVRRVAGGTWGLPDIVEVLQSAVTGAMD